jgi:hypothetical protein
MGSLYNIFLYILCKNRRKVVLGEDLVIASQLHPNLGDVLNLVLPFLQRVVEREKRHKF